MDPPTRILLVDDEADIREMAHLVLDLELQHIPLEIIEASNGRDAVRACAEDLPRVVVLDLHMPDMSGLDVLRQVVELPEPPCVVAWSADPFALRRALSFGAKFALDKTTEVHALVDAIEACLDQNRYAVD
ncbi:MAG: response regulator [Actinomycetes bacterium]